MRTSENITESILLGLVERSMTRMEERQKKNLFHESFENGLHSLKQILEEVRCLSSDDSREKAKEGIVLLENWGRFLKGGLPTFEIEAFCTDVEILKLFFNFQPAKNLGDPLNLMRWVSQEVHHITAGRDARINLELSVANTFNTVLPPQQIISDAHKRERMLLGIYQDYINRHDQYEVQQGLRGFIPLDAVNNKSSYQKKQVSALHEEHILPFLHSNNHQLLLIGESGSGKSLYLHYLEDYLWKNYQEDQSLVSREPQRIPIYLDLSGIPLEKGQPYLGKFIENTLLSLTGLTQVNATEQFLRGLPLLILLDGYDEKQGENYNIYGVNELFKWNVKIITACRAFFLTNQANYQSWFTSRNEIKVDEIYILPFDVEKVKKYLRVFQESLVEKIPYLTAFDKYPSLYCLAENPLLLSLIVQVWSQLDIHLGERYDRPITRTLIYRFCINSWFEREAKRLNPRLGETYLSLERLGLNFKSVESREAFKIYCSILAFKMFTHHPTRMLTEVAYQEQEKVLATNWRSQAFHQTSSKLINVWHQFFSNDDPNLISIRIACPLRYQDKAYRFYHRSFLEYFVALSIFDGLLDTKSLESGAKEVEQRLVDEPLNQKLLNAEPGIIQFLVEMVENDPQRKRLLEIVYASRPFPEGQGKKVSKAAANALTLLNAAGENFSGKDFSKIQVPGVKLHQAILGDVRFNKANLAHAEFYGAYLVKCNFSKANLHQARFGRLMQYPENSLTSIIRVQQFNQLILGTRQGFIYLVHIGQKKWQYNKPLRAHNSTLRAMAINRADNSVVTCGDDGYICIYMISPEGLSFYHKVEAHSDWVRSVTFSDGDDVILSAGDDGYVRVWDTKNLQQKQEIDLVSSRSVNLLKIIIHPIETAFIVIDLEGTSYFFKKHDKEYVRETFLLFKKSISAGAFNPNGNLFTAGSKISGELALYGYKDSTFQELSIISCENDTRPVSYLNFIDEQFLLIQNEAGLGFIYDTNIEKIIYKNNFNSPKYRASWLKYGNDNVYLILYNSYSGLIFELPLLYELEKYRNIVSEVLKRHSFPETLSKPCHRIELDIDSDFYAVDLCPIPDHSNELLIIKTRIKGFGISLVRLGRKEKHIDPESELAYFENYKNACFFFDSLVVYNNRAIFIYLLANLKTPETISNVRKITGLYRSNTSNFIVFSHKADLLTFIRKPSGTSKSFEKHEIKLPTEIDSEVRSLVVNTAGDQMLVLTQKLNLYWISLDLANRRSRAQFKIFLWDHYKHSFDYEEDFIGSFKEFEYDFFTKRLFVSTKWKEAVIRIFDVSCQNSDVVFLVEELKFDSTVSAILLDSPRHYLLMGTVGGYLYRYCLNSFKLIDSFRAHTEAISKIRYDEHHHRYLTIGLENAIAKSWCLVNNNGTFRLLLDHLWGCQITMVDQCVITPKASQLTPKGVHQFEKNGAKIIEQATVEAIIYPTINLTAHLPWQSHWNHYIKVILDFKCRC